MNDTVAENVIKKYGATVYEILDNTLFMDGREVRGLIRQLLRMGYNEKEAKIVLNKWVKERGYKIKNVEVVTTYKL